jgi:membrane protein insertase Oxa1/YidC/SpoIIIJ
MYWITSNLVTLVQNYVIYNYGPGRKSPAATEGGSVKSENKSKATSGSQRANGSSGVSEAAHDSVSNGGAQAARSAKRKRRKKKKK